MLVNMKKMLREARAGGYAIPAFNTQGGSYDISWAVCEAAEKAQSPIILAHYDNCSAYAGLEFFVEISRWCAEHVSVPVAIHLDHGGSVELCKRAIDAGCTSVMYDGSALPIEENAKNTAEVLAYAAPRDVSVEAEIGRVLPSATNDSKTISGNCADFADVETFLSLASPDALAVAIGNAHGFYAEKPVLNMELLSKIKAQFDVPLVLHGGTGIAVEDVQKAIRNGISKVNIGTEIRCNYVKYLYEGIREMGLQEHAWKISKRAIGLMEQDVEKVIAMCGSAGKA